MNKRRILAASALAAVMALPSGTAGAAGLENSFSDVDPDGDVNTGAIDISAVGAEWDTETVQFRVDTDSAQAPLSDPVWSRATPATEGRTLTLNVDLADGKQAFSSFVMVDGDGAKFYVEVPDAAGQSSGTPVDLCDGDVNITGNTMTIDFPADCMDNPGSINIQAAYGDAAADETDYAPDDFVDSNESFGGAAPGGYWLTASDGGVFSFGMAEFYGSMGGKALNAPVVGIAAHSSQVGYYQVASDGGVFAYGDATFKGSMGGQKLNKPMVGIAAHPDDDGYWTVASDGGVFAYGDAKFFGSMGGKPLNSPVVGIQATNSGNGYWLFAADGGVFAYGDATFYGSMGGKPLNGAISGGAKSTSGNGYRLIGEDNGVFAFGDATYAGNGLDLDAAVKGIVSSRTGYLVVDVEGAVQRFGAAYRYGDLSMIGVTPSKPIVGMAAIAGFM